ncbi:hypothetical protein SCLCIDRAFT_134320, partial [Scleroderma citrinum Foug A]
MQTLSHLHIWQQNLNTSHIAQLTLLNSPISNNWGILAIQEPALNSVNNTRASTHWRVVYPTWKFTHGNKPRAVMLVNSKISTNAWRQIDFPSADVVVIRESHGYGYPPWCMVINVYNDNNHDNMVEMLEQFLDTNGPE